MTANSDRPADTRIMGIIHGALRRDLERTTRALSSTPPPLERQRVAIAAHVEWLMKFLHGHHIGEDQGLWPIVRARNPAAGDLLDQMDADHARIAPEIDRVEKAAAAYAADGSSTAREGLVGVIESLRSVLDPHLRREEEEMMPIVSRSITRAHWDAYTNTHHVATRSKRELGREGHWLIDSLDPEGYDVVVRVVPAVPRFILLHAFAKPYRRECALRWGPHIQVTPLSRQRPRPTPS
ncbi:hemerythrin domain-containing protein [Sphaerisporangium sp. NBC_01403]|uniref:hemerythrin domain-containing protein n=1 Tax=Sphaerisporangium sp. NBC_01403 TaxID=2903599 RepID=UPI00386949D6